MSQTREYDSGHLYETKGSVKYNIIFPACFGNILNQKTTKNSTLSRTKILSSSGQQGEKELTQEIKPPVYKNTGGRWTGFVYIQWKLVTELNKV